MAMTTKKCYYTGCENEATKTLSHLSLPLKVNVCDEHYDKFKKIKSVL
jgi:hypothetical protein